MTHAITVTPPAGHFAAVQVELDDGTIVGAQTCQHPNGSPRDTVTVNVKTDVDSLFLRWVYEDDSLGTTITRYGQPRRSGGR